MAVTSVLSGTCSACPQPPGSHPPASPPLSTISRAALLFPFLCCQPVAGPSPSAPAVSHHASLPPHCVPCIDTGTDFSGGIGCSSLSPTEPNTQTVPYFFTQKSVFPPSRSHQMPLFWEAFCTVPSHGPPHPLCSGNVSCRPHLPCKASDAVCTLVTPPTHQPEFPEKPTVAEPFSSLHS